MEFRIKFEAEATAGYAAQRLGTSLGWYHAQQIREAAGCRVPYDRIDNWNNLFRRDPYVEVPPEMAENIDLFRLQNEVTVKVAAGGLNCYVSLVPDIRRDEETGEVTRASMEYELDRAAVLRDWIKAGCPLEWNPAESGEVEEVQE